MTAKTMRWTARDITALHWIHEQRCASYPQLAYLLGNGKPLGERAVRRILQRWKEAGLINEPKPHPEVRGRVVWLTPRAQREIGVERERIRYSGPSPKLIPHEIAVGWVRIWLENKGFEWRHDTAEEDVHFRADGVAVRHTDNGEITVAIEVELTAKEVVRIRQRFDDRLRRFHSLWYFVPAEKPHIKNLLAKERAQLPEQVQNRVVIKTLTEVEK